MININGKGKDNANSDVDILLPCTYTTNNHCRGYQGRILRKFRVIHRACSNLLPSYQIISSLPLIFGTLAFFLYVLVAREKFRVKGYWSSTFADELS